MGQVRIRRLVGAGGLALTIGLSALAVGPTVAASHHPTCHGVACTGLDPMASGCADAATSESVVSAPFDGGTLDLRHSTTCDTYWARVSADAGRSPEGLLVLLLPESARQSAMLTRPDDVTRGYHVWTPMAAMGQGCLQVILVLQPLGAANEHTMTLCVPDPDAVHRATEHLDELGRAFP